jgi:hypothetical protein
MVYMIQLFGGRWKYLLGFTSIGLENPRIIIGQCDNSFNILARDLEFNMF